MNDILQFPTVKWAIIGLSILLLIAAWSGVIREIKGALA